MPSDLVKIARGIGNWIFNQGDGGQLIRTSEDLARYLQLAQNQTVAGPITEGQALRVSAVYACVRLLSDSIAMLPCSLYEKVGRKNVIAANNPVHLVLSIRPNSWQTAYEFWRMVITHLLLRGNFYAEKVIYRSKVTDLIPLNPAWMRAKVLETGGIVYEYRKNGTETVIYSQEQIFHVRGLSIDGVTGMSVLEAARNSIGVSIKTEEYSAQLFTNGVRPSGVLQSEKALNKEAYERLREDFTEHYAGAGNNQRPMILEDGLTWQQMSMTAEDSQFIDQRKYSVAEIARFFGVPPHAIGDIDRGTSWGSGIEQQNVGFLIHTLGPYLVNIQQTCIRDLLPRSDQTKFVVKFDTALLTRPDFKARQTGYQIMTTNGAMSRNEWREKEGFEPIEDPEADEYRSDAAPASGASSDSAPEEDDSED